MNDIFFYHNSGVGANKLNKENELQQLQLSLALASNLKIIDSLEGPFSLFRERYKVSQPRCLHISTHGKPVTGEPIFNSIGNSVGRAIRYESFIELFCRNNSTHCLILNYCQSEELSLELEEFFPYIIFSNDDIDDFLANKFSYYFFLALLSNNGVKAAFENAKYAIADHSSERTNDFLNAIQITENYKILSKMNTPELNNFQTLYSQEQIDLLKSQVGTILGVVEKSLLLEKSRVAFSNEKYICLLLALESINKKIYSIISKNTVFAFSSKTEEEDFRRLIEKIFKRVQYAIDSNSFEIFDKPYNNIYLIREKSGEQKVRTAFRNIESTLTEISPDQIDVFRTYYEMAIKKLLD